MSMFETLMFKWYNFQSSKIFKQLSYILSEFSYDM